VELKLVQTGLEGCAPTVLPGDVALVVKGKPDEMEWRRILWIREISTGARLFRRVAPGGRPGRLLISGRNEEEAAREVADTEIEILGRLDGVYRPHKTG